MGFTIFEASVSDYAVTGNDVGTGSLLAALADAGFLIGLKRNRFVILVPAILSIEAIRDATGLYQTQRRYIADLLTKSKMDGAKPCSTLMSTSVTLTVTDTEAFDDPTLYRSIVGGLHYLSFTRPNIAFVIHRVSKFLHQPKQSY
ncbi:hypothetical protein POTOM_044349 [Populus tomentosa]|uniref:Reverse transcriptase Ty1/copia-type domain-containing protein n=1 Tax=Populus tomentosa TaxID=118781 RepID=A0A8X7YLM6_POPTO|nr:hypothetical protein POTOM_044349 [Populus tomentosa]